MTAKPPLSPAAQAVLDAVVPYFRAALFDFGDFPYGPHCIAAAALRAAASQAEGLLWDEDARFGDGVMATSGFIENIAAELEAHP